MAFARAAVSDALARGMFLSAWNILDSTRLSSHISSLSSNFLLFWLISSLSAIALGYFSLSNSISVYLNFSLSDWNCWFDSSYSLINLSIVDSIIARFWMSYIPLLSLEISHIELTTVLVILAIFAFANSSCVKMGLYLNINSDNFLMLFWVLRIEILSIKDFSLVFITLSLISLKSYFS